MAHGKFMPLDGSLVERMRQCVLMQSLEPDCFNEIKQISQARKISENYVLFEQGEALTYLYLLVSGGIKLQRLAPNGNEKVLRIVHPNQTFAEAVLFSGRDVYPVSSIAVSDSVVIAIKAKPYLALLKKSSTLYLNLLSNLSVKLHWMVDEVDRLTLHNAAFRLANYSLSHTMEDSSNNVKINLGAPKNVIASRLSIKQKPYLEL